METSNCFKILLLSALCMVFIPLVASADLSNPPTGSYYGSASIDSPTPDMATVDLAFYLDVDGTNVLVHDNSCIRLDKTMLFPELQPVVEIWDNSIAPPVLLETIECGPRMNGTFSLDTFDILSDEFTSNVGDKVVTRQVVLNQAIIENEGQSISGTYTETVTGILPEPVVINGEFILLRPVPLSAAVFADSNGDGCLDLSEIRAGGDNPATMEFRDASGAMAIYNSSSPEITPLCAPADQTARDAMEEFYQGQQ